MASIEQGRFDEILLARLRLNEAARVVTTSAHQVHAAIGVTFEHSLHRATRRDDGQNVADISAHLADVWIMRWVYYGRGKF